MSNICDKNVILNLDPGEIPYRGLHGRISLGRPQYHLPELPQ